MTFCIVNTTTRRKVMPSIKTRKVDYKSRAAALTAMNKFLNSFVDERDWVEAQIVIMTQEEYRAQVRMKRVKSLMSGEWIEIPEDTPAYLDPSMETYWSR